MAASPESLDLARRLIALERARGPKVGSRESERDGPGGAFDPVARVCETLRGTLTTFAGTSGFRSLLTRALALAKVQEPALANVQVLEDGSLAGLEQLHGTSSRKVRAAGGAIVAQLLDLLIILIGEPLTLHLVRSTWPAVSANASRSKDKDTV